MSSGTSDIVEAPTDSAFQVLEQRHSNNDTALVGLLVGLVSSDSIPFRLKVKP